MNTKEHSRTDKKFERIFTLREVCQIFQLGRVTALRLIWSGRLVGFKIGRTWRIRESDLEKFLATFIKKTRVNKP